MQTSRAWIDELIAEIGYDFSGINSIMKGDGYELFNISSVSNTFIIDAEEGRAIAADPSVVGEEFDRYNTRLAFKAAQAMRKIGLLDRKSVFLDVLRAAPGYRLYEGITREKRDMEISRVSMRPKYVKRSYQAHVYNELEIIYSDLKSLPTGHVTLFKPDTEASGKTSLAALGYFLDECKKAGCTVDMMVLYGFISKPGLLKIIDFLKGRDIEYYAFAIENLTALSGNGYDMPLYGVDKGGNDPGLLLKSIAPYEVVSGMAGDYYPGLDQPGDWSERQSNLFTGVGYESGGILNHLQMSLKNLSELRPLSESQSWYKQPHRAIYDLLVRKINERLNTYTQNSG